MPKRKEILAGPPEPGVLLALSLTLVLLLTTTIPHGRAIGAEPLAKTASASIDQSCLQRPGSFVVPASKVASGFQLALSSAWLPCAGTSRPTRIGARIRDANNQVLYYGVQSSNNKRQDLAGALKTLSLGPGRYTLEVADGGQRTSASLRFVLLPGTPSTTAAGTGPDSVTWGNLSGEWTDPQVKSKARIVHSGQSLTISNTFVWQGKTVQWTGQGSVTGNTVQFTFIYTRNKPVGWLEGKMLLTRTGKQTLTGKWVTHSGQYSQPITFVQVRPDKAPPPKGHDLTGQATKKTAAERPAPPHPRVQPKQGHCPRGQFWNGRECMPLHRPVEQR